MQLYFLLLGFIIVKMAKNKNIFPRLKALDEILKDGSGVNHIKNIQLKLLNKGFDICIRTIYSDINYLQSKEGYNAPILKKKIGGSREISYQYEYADFTIKNSSIVAKDLHNLKTSLDSISQFTNIKGFENIDSLITQLKANLDINQTIKPIVSLSENNHLKGLEYLIELFDYIKSESVLLIKYQPFQVDEILTITISPYHLKQFNNRWFLFGQNHAHEDYIQNLALDRIKEIKKCEKSQYIPTDLDFKKYFHAVIGVTIPKEKVEKIKLQFSEKRFPYVVTKPIHATQINLANHVVQLTLKINPELMSLILSYGSDVKVLEPQTLVEQMKEETLKMVEGYKSVLLE